MSELPCAIAFNEISDQPEEEAQAQTEASNNVLKQEEERNNNSNSNNRLLACLATTTSSDDKCVHQQQEVNDEIEEQAIFGGTNFDDYDYDLFDSNLPSAHNSADTTDPGESIAGDSIQTTTQLVEQQQRSASHSNITLAAPTTTTPTTSHALTSSIDPFQLSAAAQSSEVHHFAPQAPPPPTGSSEFLATPTTAIAFEQHSANTFMLFDASMLDTSPELVEMQDTISGGTQTITSSSSTSSSCTKGVEYYTTSLHPQQVCNDFQNMTILSLYSHLSSTQ